MNDDPKKKLGWEEKKESGEAKGGSATKDTTEMKDTTEEKPVGKHNEDLPEERNR